MTPSAIYEDLKEKIIWLKIKPGTTLNLVDLAKSYHVSRNPVTIALTRLETEEWVIRNGSHFVVSPLTLERMRDITEVRLLMEVQANIWTMHRISAEGLNELKKIKKEISELKKEATKEDIIHLDVRFHRLIYRETQNAQLEVMLDRMLNHYLRFWLSRPSRIDQDAFFSDILETIDAIERKDETRLHAACTAHVKSSLDEIMGLA